MTIDKRAINKDLQKALVDNWINSPFVSQELGNGEKVINEHHLYFVRQVRDPVPVIGVAYGAEFFTRLFSGPWQKDEETRKRLLLHYEQFFARIELLSQIIRFEALIRSLIHSHLIKSIDHDDLNNKNLLTEQDNIIIGALGLVRALVQRDCEQNTATNFPKKKFYHFVDKLKTIYIEPLIVLRNAMCHGNIRAYIRNLTKQRSLSIGPSTSYNADGRAISIYENIDAISYYMLSKNIGIMHRLIYSPLVHYKPGQLIHSIMENANYTFKTGYMMPDFMWLGLPKKYMKFKNKELREACINPSKLYAEFAKSCNDK